MLAKYDCAKHKFPLIENVNSLQKTNKAINKRFLKNAGRVQKSPKLHLNKFLRKTRLRIPAQNTSLRKLDPRFKF